MFSFDLGGELPLDIQRTRSEQDIAEKGLKGSSKLWIGKDYVNFIHKDFVELESPYAGEESFTRDLFNNSLFYKC